MMDCTLPLLIHVPSSWQISTTVSRQLPSIKSWTAAIFSGVMLVLVRHWWIEFSTASLYPRNSLCQNFTCVFDSVDSLYCVHNLHQISLRPFLLIKNFITTCCAIVIGTSLLLILNSTNWGEGRVWWQGEEGAHSPPHHRTRSLPNHAHSLVATDRGRFIFDLPTYLPMKLCIICEDLKA